MFIVDCIRGFLVEGKLVSRSVIDIYIVNEMFLLVGVVSYFFIYIGIF